MATPSVTEELFGELLADRIKAMEPPSDPHTNAWTLGFCRARKMASDIARAAGWSERELAAIQQLCRELELSPMQVLRCALRHYQSDHERLKAGETVSWSGDAQRAADFAGPLADQPPPYTGRELQPSRDVIDKIARQEQANAAGCHAVRNTLLGSADTGLTDVERVVSLFRAFCRGMETRAAFRWYASSTDEAVAAFRREVAALLVSNRSGVESEHGLCICDQCLKEMHIKRERAAMQQPVCADVKRLLREARSYVEQAGLRHHDVSGLLAEIDAALLVSDRSGVGRKDETCIVRHRRHGTVICGQVIVEKYLRKGYTFDWEATDKARALDIPTIPEKDEQ